MPTTIDLTSELRATIRGTVLAAGDDGYDSARAVWNAMIDRHPGIVVRAAGVNDVLHAVAFARAHALRLAVKGG